jgi:hypothetical protein
MSSLAVFRGYSLTSIDRLQEDFFLSMQRSKNLPIPLKNSKIRINAWEASDNFSPQYALPHGYPFKEVALFLQFRNVQFDCY